ncbi:hypothetical protein SAMN03159343_3862 [Klenkia marina]|uniref:Putative membrane protein insertion efficiency factor n=1 Tax=Klenkia marina TaxID=1960309 RepID=A0A1G4Z111_9ACTN|nr:membrane protein insertion efficiency factor YidD [Klenkia marina]SCX58918.1 hypothetical protein SAMN03159343_3862 [Klenkia marina]
MSTGARALLGLIGFYRRGISPLLGPRCRFTPTCSEYAQEAVQVHGAARGGWLAAVRIAKCAPWHRGGVDLVPAARGTAQLIHSSDTGVRPATPSARSSEARVA